MIVSGRQQRNSAIHTHAPLFRQTPLPSRLPRNPEQSGLGGEVAVMGYPPAACCPWVMGYPPAACCPWVMGYPPAACCPLVMGYSPVVCCPWVPVHGFGPPGSVRFRQLWCSAFRVPCSPLCTLGLGLALITKMLVLFKWRKGILIFGSLRQTLPSRLL